MLISPGWRSRDRLAIEFHYRTAIVKFTRITTKASCRNGPSRSPQRLHSPAYSSSCRRRGTVWPMDDRRVGTPRLSIESGNALSVAARIGKERLPGLAPGARGAYLAKILSSNSSRPQGDQVGYSESKRVVR